MPVCEPGDPIYNQKVMVKALSILLISMMVRIGHATESALEPQKENAATEEETPPKKTAGGFIELEIEGDDDKTAGESDREQASEAENADSGDSNEGGA